MHVREAVQRFYEQHPYPPPSPTWKATAGGGRTKAGAVPIFICTFRDGLPRGPGGAGRRVRDLAGGAARPAPAGVHVVGIDVSAASCGHTEALKSRTRPIESRGLAPASDRAGGELGRTFDLIVCTGVLHHLPDPAEGLRALRGGPGARWRDGPDGLRHLRPGRRLHASGLLPPARRGAGERRSTTSPSR